MVFAAVVTTATIILAQAYPAFPHLTYDVAALVHGVSAGYAYELNTFRDGAIWHYQTSYSGSDVNVYIGVDGWDYTDVATAVHDAYARAGYVAKVNKV